MPERAVLHHWDDVPREQVTPSFARKLITGDRIMLTHIYLSDGCVVPQHSHENEQLSYILEGRLRFALGDDESEVVDVGPGDVLHLPSNLPHSAVAFGDTVAIDVFSPPRQDWLDGTDDYLRR